MRDLVGLDVILCVLAKELMTFGWPGKLHFYLIKLFLNKRVRGLSDQY